MQSKKILSDIHQSYTEVIDFFDYRIAIYINKARYKEEKQDNEDIAFFNFFDETNILLGIADGAGGHPRGKDAAINIGDTIINSFNNKFQPIESIERANQRVLDMKSGSRSTLCFVTIREEKLRCYSVGDSEIIFWNNVGSEIYSNIPHSNVGYKVEAGVLDQEKSLEEPDRYIVNNLMGDNNIRIESTSSMEIKRGQTLLLGSDGLFDNISHTDLQEIVGKGIFEKSFLEVSRICDEQPETTWIKEDDISFILVRKIK